MPEFLGKSKKQQKVASVFVFISKREQQKKVTCYMKVTGGQKGYNLPGDEQVSKRGQFRKQELI